MYSILRTLRGKMIKPERSTYTPLDFREWNSASSLILSPKFQRRGVWTAPARSYLIDTLLLGMPVPPIYLRVVQNPERSRMIREVIDGQQRISAVLDYMGGKFPVASNLDSVAAGKRYSELSENQQNEIAQYPFICEVFYGIEDRDVLQIFARMNTNSVKLNAQELRNGRYFGPFKRSAYGLAFEHLEFWRQNRIFTERSIARMAEAELTSELIILEIDGIQDKKTSINDYYEKFDEQFPVRDKVERNFRMTLDEITEATGDTLNETEFRRSPLFYSLFSATYHRIFGVPKQKASTPAKGRLVIAEREGLNTALRKLSDLVTSAKAEETVPKTYRPFVTACLRQTDNLRPRQTRHDFLYKEAFGER